MINILTCLLCILAVCSYGQDYEFPLLKRQARSAQDFSPPGWFVSDSIEGDLNMDNLIDKVFIIKKNDSVTVQDSNGDEYVVQPRIITIAFKNVNGGYVLSEINPRFLMNYNFPRTYEDPFTAMNIENGVLTIRFSFDYVIGNFLFYTYEFGFQNSQFVLVGASAQSVTRRTMYFETTNFDFLTMQWSLTIGTHTNEDPPKLIEKTEKFELKIDKLKTFKTMDRPGTWQVINDRWL